MRQIREVADAYKVYFAKASDGADATIDHSAFIYLLDRNGKYLGFFPPNTSVDQLVQVVQDRISRSSSDR